VIEIALNTEMCKVYSYTRYLLNFLQLKLKRRPPLVVRVPGYKSRDPSSIPGATKFSEK
jgi:hypothetical protein